MRTFREAVAVGGCFRYMSHSLMATRRQARDVEVGDPEGDGNDGQRSCSGEKRVGGGFGAVEAEFVARWVGDG